ncbi:MAG: urease accessory protein UreE [Hyphomicrobiales bacterium]|nr:MAG: urease accessory protein UreE [Hyphomicrobiales bacterium]
MIAASTILDHTNNPADTITLDETARHRRRVKMVSDGGIEFLLDLPKAKLLRHGEGLVLDDGRVIEVVAAPEELFEVTARDAHHLLQLAWQLGNRHLPAQIGAGSGSGTIRIRRDEVIRDMLLGLGADVKDISGPFDPEGGAYDQRHSHD